MAIVDPQADGNPTTPPPLPPEAIRLGIKADAVGRMDFPKEHWSTGLQPGDSKLSNGVHLAHLPKNQSKVVLVGLEGAEQPALDVAPIDDEATDGPAKSKAQHVALCEWLGAYYGNGLPGTKRQALTDLYKQTAVEAQNIASKSGSYNTPTSVEAARLAMAKLGADVSVRELSLFADSPEASQVRRFGQKLPGNLILPAVAVLGKQLARILRGDYLGEDIARARVNLGQLRRELPSPLVTEVTGGGIMGRLWRTQYEWLGTATLIGYEARGYVAEHPAQGADWESYGLRGFYHTSIVAGIWAVQRQQRRVTQYSENRDTPNTSWMETVVRADFVAWRVGCGAASTYDAQDKLRPIFRWTANSWESAERMIRTLTPTEANKYYRIRSAAYCKGNYGLHWVCHQTANAFSSRKWGLTPVTYPVSWALYGPYGLQGISSHLDLTGTVRLGCVPGVECFYNVTPPYSVPDPVLVIAEEADMSGAGLGLESHWNPKRQLWVESGASFAPTAVPFAGPSELLAVQRQ